MKQYQLIFFVLLFPALLFAQDDTQAYQLKFSTISTKYFLMVKGGDTLVSDFKITPKENAKELEYNLSEFQDTFKQSFIVSKQFTYKKFESTVMKGIQIWDSKTNQISKYSMFKTPMEKGMESGFEKIDIGIDSFINTSAHHQQLIDPTKIDTLDHICKLLHIPDDQKSEPIINYKVLLSTEIKFPLNIFIPNIGAINQCPVLIDKQVAATEYELKLKLGRNAKYFNLGDKSILISLESVEPIEGKSYKSVNELIEKQK